MRIDLITRSQLEVLNKKGPISLFLALESYESELDSLYYRETIPKKSIKEMISKIILEV